MMAPYKPHKGGQEQSPGDLDSSLPGNEDDEIQLLLVQHRQLSELMGGVLPPLLEPLWGSRVLDMGWCAGGLVYEMAWRYPSVQITGIDANASVVEKIQSLVRGLGNASVMVQDIHRLDDEVFPPASFDLIHLRFLTGDVTLQQFPPLLWSLVRMCRPGGLIVWTEAELPITTSLACRHLCALIQRGLLAGGHISSRGNSSGVTARMGPWLNEAGCRITQSRVDAIDISAGSQGHGAFVRQVQLSGKQARTFLLGMGIMTAEEFEEVYLEMRHEIEGENFCGMLYVRTLVGLRSLVM
jgi:hypothetical protein